MPLYFVRRSPRRAGTQFTHAVLPTTKSIHQLPSCRTKEASLQITTFGNKSIPEIQNAITGAGMSGM